MKIEGGQVVFKTLSKEMGPSLGYRPTISCRTRRRRNFGCTSIFWRRQGSYEFMHHDGGHYHVGRMTWEGYDFLDAVRNPEVWKRTKEGASKMGGWTFALLKDLGTAYLRHIAKERLNLEI